MVSDCFKNESNAVFGVFLQKLTIYDVNQEVIDSLSNEKGFVRNLFAEKYFAQKIIVSPEETYTLRGEYTIIRQSYLWNMSITEVTSAIASVVVIIILILLGLTLQHRHVEIQNMQRSFDGAIHDLKSPLAYVYLSLSTLEEKEPDLNKKMELSLVADRVSCLNDKILNKLHSKLFSQKVTKQQKQEIFLFDLLEQIETEIKTLFPSKKIQFDNAFDTDLTLFVSPGLFESTIYTLLENAVKYNNDNPNIIISANSFVDFIQISVQDNGEGISKMLQKKIFKPYYTSDKLSGTGIGLFYAKRIIEAHGGTISVESKPTKGATFIIKIPTE